MAPSQPLTQLKLLINLAHIDGGVGEKEEQYIYNIASANGVAADVIRPLFKTRQELIVPTDLSNDQKFNYIFSLVQLMKIDERLYNDEIRFCSKVAARLGYNEAVMFDLMLHVKSVMGPNEMEDLKKLTARYLKQ